MPIYEYACVNGHRFEVILHFGAMRAGVVDRRAADRARQADPPIHPGQAMLRGVPAGPREGRLGADRQPGDLAKRFQCHQMLGPLAWRAGKNDQPLDAGIRSQ